MLSALGAKWSSRSKICSQIARHCRTLPTKRISSKWLPTELKIIHQWWIVQLWPPVLLYFALHFFLNEEEYQLGINTQPVTIKPTLHGESRFSLSGPAFQRAARCRQIQALRHVAPKVLASFYIDYCLSRISSSLFSILVFQRELQMCSG